MRRDSAYYTKGKDIIILQFVPDTYTFDEIKNMYESIKQIFPNNDCLVLPANISLSIIREENPFL